MTLLAPGYTSQAPGTQSLAGSCSERTVPSRLRRFPFFPVLGSDAESTTTSGVGTWTMKGTRWERELSLQFKELSGRPEIVGGLQTYLVCQGKGTSGRLFYFVGDPDQNERIVYRRAAIGGK